MFHSQAPLHKIWRVEFAVGDGGDRNRGKTTCGIRLRRCAGELTLGKSRGKNLIRGNGCVNRAVGHTGRDGCTSERAAARGSGGGHRAKQTSLKRFVVGRIGTYQISHTSWQDVAENSETAAEYRFRLELPRDCRSRLQNGQRRRGERIVTRRLVVGVQRV